MDKAGLLSAMTSAAPLSKSPVNMNMMGFGAHYLARPTARLHDEILFLDITMDVENLSSAPMELMYMCHVNFAYAEGAQIVPASALYAGSCAGAQPFPATLRPMMITCR